MNTQASRPDAPNAHAEHFAAWLLQGRDELRKGERTRTDLLVAGARLLSAETLDSLTVAGVCKAAGVAHGTFYIYFANRNVFAAEVLELFVDYVQLEMRSAARLPGSASRNTTAAYMRIFEENTGLMKCLVVGVDAFPEARSAFQRLNHEWTTTVTRAWLRNNAQSPRSEAELMRRAYALGGMVDQYLTALFVTGDPWVRALSQDREEVLEMFTDLWKRGMQT